jgi:hypothetical protein
MSNIIKILNFIILEKQIIFISSKCNELTIIIEVINFNIFFKYKFIKN